MRLCRFLQGQFHERRRRGDFPGDYEPHVHPQELELLFRLVGTRIEFVAVEYRGLALRSHSGILVMGGIKT